MASERQGAPRPPSTSGSPSDSVALDGCRIERVLSGRVEIVEAKPGNRSFPDRVTDSLGICLKRGPDHEVRSDAKTLTYPRDSVCIRTPSCVWATRTTGEVAFLSIDIEKELLPPGGVRGPMRFAERSSLPDVVACAATLRSEASALHKETVVTELVDALFCSNLVTAPELEVVNPKLPVERAREILTSTLVEPPSLQALADVVGANRFVLLREFRRRFGLPPHAYLLRQRVERARAWLARGGDIVEVAHSLGFADQSHLTRAFKRVFGLSPAAYRRLAWSSG